MNIDLIESVSRSLSNVDVINMALVGPDMKESLKHVIAKRRIDNFARSLEKVLRLANNVRMFTNEEIADMMFLCEEHWIHSDIMNNILEKLSSYMEPMFETVDISYDGLEPFIEFTTTVDDFVVSLIFDAGISCTTYRPVYDWHGVSLSRIDIYSKTHTFLMSWSKNYDKRIDTISYTHNDEDFISREHKHDVRDTFVRFDSFKMTPSVDMDTDTDSDEDGMYFLYDGLISTQSVDQMIDPDHKCYKFASEAERVMDNVFFKPRNCVEEIMYKSSDVVSKFLIRYQTWSTTNDDRYVHARDEPEWYDHSFFVFVDDLNTYTKKLFGEWVCDRDYINDEYEQLWTFTRKMHDSIFVLTFCIIECCFSWTLVIDKYDVNVNILTQEYSVSIDDDEVEDDDGKQFEEKKLNVLFESIGLKKTHPYMCMKPRHFTSEEISNILH